MKIFIITHKKFDVPKVDECYEPLLVGAMNRPEELKKMYLCDDSGNNISGLNDSYCELTGLYWIWKNVSDKCVGLVHYRRYFAVVRGHKFKSRYFVLNKSREDCFHVLNSNEIYAQLQDYDLLVKESETFFYDNETVFRRHPHVGDENWENLYKLISTEYPAYFDALKKFSNDKKHINCNMFVGKKSIIDEYCEWLFPILEKMDSLHISARGKRYTNREMGYFAEILFGIYLNTNSVKYKIIDAINTSNRNIEDTIMNWYELPLFLIKYYYHKTRARIDR